MDKLSTFWTSPWLCSNCRIWRWLETVATLCQLCFALLIHVVTDTACASTIEMGIRTKILTAKACGLISTVYTSQGNKGPLPGCQHPCDQADPSTILMLSYFHASFNWKGPLNWNRPLTAFSVLQGLQQENSGQVVNSDLPWSLLPHPQITHNHMHCQTLFWVWAGD